MFRRLEGVLAGALEAQGDTFRMVTVSLPSSGDPVADIQDEAAVAAEVAAHSGTAAVFGIFDADRTVVVEKYGHPLIIYLPGLDLPTTIQISDSHLWHLSLRLPA